MRIIQFCLNVILFISLLIDRYNKYFHYQRESSLDALNAGIYYDIVILIAVLGNIILFQSVLYLFPLADLILKLVNLYYANGENVFWHLYNNLTRQGAVASLIMILIFQMILNIFHVSKEKTKEKIIQKDMKRSPANSTGSNNPSRRRKIQPLI